MEKALLLSIGILGCLVQSASAQNSLFTTANDFGQFNGGVVTVSSLYYSDNSTVNGIGNTVSPGGADALGSLQLTAPGGWQGWVAGSDWPGATYDLFQAINPGGARPWSAESGYGAGNVVAYSGVMSFDLYGGNLTDWNWWGVTFNYDGNWYQAWATTSSDFTGSDGRRWTHYIVPFTMTAQAGITYFGMGFAENAGSIAGETICIDNIQVTQVPEPSIFAFLGVGMTGLLLRRRR
jgi:PEP-CTERM motif